MTVEDSVHSLEQRNKSLDAVYWGGVLLWAGLIFGADALGYLPGIGAASAWGWIFLGAGMYGLLLALLRVSSPRYSTPTTWDWAWALIFIVFGAAGFLSINVPWWLVLILIGGTILANAVLRSE